MWFLGVFCFGMAAYLIVICITVWAIDKCGYELSINPKTDFDIIGYDEDDEGGDFGDYEDIDGGPSHSKCGSWPSEEELTWLKRETWSQN